VRARRPGGEAAKWSGYLPVFVRILVEFRPRRQPDRAVDLPAGATVGDLLRSVGESADHNLAVRGETPVPEAEALREGESILLLSAFSGG
jgi:sulfur carrier protein ThiS